MLCMYLIKKNSQRDAVLTVIDWGVYAPFMCFRLRMLLHWMLCMNVWWDTAQCYRQQVVWDMWLLWKKREKLFQTTSNGILLTATHLLLTGKMIFVVMRFSSFLCIYIRIFSLKYLRVPIFGLCKHVYPLPICRCDRICNLVYFNW